MRPIDADALLEKDEWLTWDGDSYNVIHVIDVFCAPTLDVEPMRHGRWVKRFCHPMRDGEWQYICSACKDDDYWHENVCIQEHNYCPNCGAKMDF